MTLILQFLGCSVSWFFFLNIYFLRKPFTIYGWCCWPLTFHFTCRQKIRQSCWWLNCWSLFALSYQSEKPVDCHGNIFGLSWSPSNHPCCHAACLFWRIEMDQINFGKSKTEWHKSVTWRQVVASCPVSKKSKRKLVTSWCHVLKHSWNHGGAGNSLFGTSVFTCFVGRYGLFQPVKPAVLLQGKTMVSGAKRRESLCSWRFWFVREITETICEGCVEICDLWMKVQDGVLTFWLMVQTS